MRQLFVLFAAFILAGRATAAGPTPLPLRLELAAASTRVPLTGTFTFDVRLRNTSSDPVTLYGSLLWGHAAGLVLHITDANGKPVHPPTLDDDLVIPSTMQNRDFFVTLQKNHYLGITRSDPARTLFPRPGTYTVWVEYLSPVPPGFGQGTNVWGRDRGAIVSAKVKVVVVR